MTAQPPLRPAPAVTLAAQPKLGDHVAAAGRSSMLRAGLRVPGRARPYLRRASVVAALLGLVGLLVAAVATVWFRPDGPARLIYVMHDTVWLPLRGLLWVAPFPGGLVWLVPVLGLSALVLVEYLGLAAPLRRAQTAGIGLLLRSKAAPVLVLWDGSLRRVGLRAGQVRSVAVDLRDAARIAVICAIEAGQGAGPLAALLGREQVALQLSEGRQADLVAALETLCLLRLAAVMGAGAGGVAAGGVSDDALVETIARKSGLAAPKWRALAEGCRRATLGPRASVAAADGLAGGGCDASTAAVNTLLAALAAVQTGQPCYLIWFDVWARRRAGADPAETIRLAEAESLIAFEFWAAQAEARTHHPGANDLLAEAFADHIGPRIRGEVFARTGRERPMKAGRA